MLRRGVLAWRAGIEPEDLARRSRGLAQRVIEHPRWSEAEGVAAFVGVRGEPDTRPLLRAALAAGKRLWLPRVSDDRARIEFLPVASLDELVPGVMGLLEPPRGAPAPLHAAQGLGLILVPGLAFDRAGRRLGFGKGHYDRALAGVRLRELPTRVGLCLEEALEPGGEPLPADEHDVPMHWVLTPSEQLRCSPQ